MSIAGHPGKKNGQNELINLILSSCHAYICARENNFCFRKKEIIQSVRIPNNQERRLADQRRSGVGFDIAIPSIGQGSHGAVSTLSATKE